MGSPLAPQPKPWEIPLPSMQPAPAPQQPSGIAAMLGQIFSAVAPQIQSTQQIAGPQPPQPQTTPEEQIQRRELFKKFGQPQ